jgi:ABC-type sugar transport system ATPase subunit
MVRRPDIFLMDEPLSNLDAKLRVTMRGELRRFHLDLNATTIYVTHDQLEAMTMSDLIAVMHGGIVQQFGAPAEIYSRPANLFVAGFIGSPPMNFIEGTLAARGAQSAFVAPTVTVAPLDLEGDFAGRDVVLGVRPQDLELVDHQESNAARGRVWIVELVGSEKLVEVELGERCRVTVQVRADRPVQVDEPVGVRLDPARVHIFDSREGNVLSRKGSGAAR